MQKKLKGLTLIELLITMTITIVIILAMSAFGNNMSNKSISLKQDLILQDEMSRTFRELGSHLKDMQLSNTGAYSIISANATSLSFYSDIDNNGTPEQVRYFIGSDQVFKRGIIKATSTPSVYLANTETITDLIHGVVITGTDPIFTYFDSSYPAVETPMSPIQISNIKVVKTTITARGQAKLSLPITLSIINTLRSLKIN